MKKRVLSLFLGLSLMIGLALLVACGATLEPTPSPEPTSPPPTATATATATAPPPTATATPTQPPFTAMPTVDPYVLALAGAYEVIMPDDFPWPGKWILRFYRTGLVTSYWGGYTVDQDSYSVSENQLVVYGGDTCGVIYGKYEWSLEGNTLTLEAISDSCEDRKVIYTQPLTKID